MSIKRIVWGLIVLLITILLGINLAIKNVKRLNSYYDKTIEIKNEDSLNLKVKNVWINGGYVYLNDSLDFKGDVLKSNIEIRDLLDLDLPVYLSKAAQNDTIWIKSNIKTFYFVLRKKD
jgi:hypothetical protein